VTFASLPVTELPPPRQAALEAKSALAAACGGRVSSRDLDRLSYARDLWPLAMLWVRQGKTPPPPDLIVWPSSEEEVAAVILIARQRGLSVIPFGAGSGVCGGTIATNGGLMLDLKRFDAIGPIDPVRRCVDVGAGVLGEALERHLEAKGFTLGHFPSSMAMSTVGGWLAARSAGQFSSRYGKLEDMVLSVRGVLGTAEPFETRERPFAGPDVAQLLIGSEGTLCAFTSARLRVHPVPQARVFRAFEFSSVQVGLLAIRRMFRDGLRPTVVRLYDPFDTAIVGKPGKQRTVATAPSARSALEVTVVPVVLKTLAEQALGRAWLLNPLTRLVSKSRLVLMFEGETLQAEAEERAAAACCLSLGATDLGETPGRDWFKRRYDVGFKLSRLMESDAFVDTLEVSAPWSQVSEVYERVRAAAAPVAFVLCHFSHAYLDGCSLYFTFVGSGPSEAAMEDRYHRLWQSALSAAMSAGANVSHHHGVGLLKARAYQQSLGEGRHALAALKRTFDPDGIMNPGKLGL